MNYVKAMAATPSGSRVLRRGGWWKTAFATSPSTSRVGIRTRTTSSICGGCCPSWTAQDLSDHGLLDSTIVWVGGEFGRTPRVQWEAPWNGGRGHHGKVFSTVLAGGGFKGGHVVGASDKRGEELADRPVYPWDLIASIHERLGIDPSDTIPHSSGDVRLVPSAADGYNMGGRLTEIM